MVHVIWTDPAIEDLAEIVDYIARDSPRYAVRTGERIYDAVGKLSLGARAGWVVPEFGIENFREILVRPYRIIYDFAGRRLLHCGHCARQPGFAAAFQTATIAAVAALAGLACLVTMLAQKRLVRSPVAADRS